MPTQTRIALVGADGCMGRAVLDAMRDPFTLGAAFVRADNPHCGRTAQEAGLGPSDARLSSIEDARPTLKACDVVLSFATPAADLAFASLAAELRIPVVVGTTGHSPWERERLAAAATAVPIVLAPNFSIGIAVVQTALAALGPLRDGFDPAIVEVHHAAKRDAPSGTALALAAALGRAFGDAPGGADDGAPRIPISSIRGGGVPGDHSVILAGAHEIVRIEHRVLSRGAFAQGALLAARWAASPRSPALYSFFDVLEGNRGTLHEGAS